MAKKFDVITVGSALRDTMYYTEHAHVVKNPRRDPTCQKILGIEYGAKVKSDDVFQGFGGGASNAAVNFAGLGLQTSVLASIGDDRDGDMLKDYWHDLGVDTSLLNIDKKAQTGFSFLLVNSETGEHSAMVHYGAAANIHIAKTRLARLQTDWFYVASLNGQRWKTLLNSISQRPARIAWNPGGTQLAVGYSGLKRIIARTDVLILNRDEATELVFSHPDAPKKKPSVKQLLKMIHMWGPQIVLVTDGKKGAYAFDGERHFFQASPQDTPKDTTGAGDCYGSSFVTGLVRYDGDILRAMQLAQRNATSLVKKVGAQSGLLKWRDLPKKMQS
jgi:ribokinase